MPQPDDKPVERHPITLGEMYGVVMHPAFRIGFLDARAGRAIDHDCIMDRIASETPEGALKRMAFDPWSAGGDIFSDPVDKLGARMKRVALAQYRYEEGRKLFLEFGVRCKAWGHPDFPPAQVRTFLPKYLEELRNQGDDHAAADTIEGASLRT